MEIQILSLVLILTCWLVGIRSIAARSLAVARLRIPSSRHHVHGRASAVSPHFPQRREASHGGHRPPRFLFSNALSRRRRP
jgi:hypothetical protein